MVGRMWVCHLRAHPRHAYMETGIFVKGLNMSTTTVHSSKGVAALQGWRSPRRGWAVGVVVALVVGGVGLRSGVDAAGLGVPSEFVPITPCRLADTRSGTDSVGARSTPLGANESVPFAVWGANGACAVPSSATGIVTNVTAVNPTASSYLTVYPGDVQRPLASNLNVSAGSLPTPNQVTVGLSATGGIRIYNLAGTVDVAIDIVGYYQPATSSAGPPGPVGPAGAAGPPGLQGPQGVVGISGYEVVLVAGILEIGVRDGFFEANCPLGKKVLGGGVATFNKDIKILSSSPLDDGGRWFVSTSTYSATNIATRSAVNVRIVCANVSP